MFDIECMTESEIDGVILALPMPMMVDVFIDIYGEYYV